MVFRKYRSVTQWGKQDTRIFKAILNARNERRMPRFKIPDAVKALGVPIYDPTEKGFFESDSVKEAEASHQKLTNTPPITDHPLYNSQPCRLFDGSDPMSDGIAQACVLSKSICHMRFPEKVMERALKDIDESKVRDAILHGERYDPTLEKLPRRFDPVLFWVTHPRVHGTPVIVRNNIILDNLYRYVVFSASKQLKPETFRLDRDEPISSILSSAPHFAQSPFVLRFQPHLTVQTTKTFPPWASPEQVKQLEEEPLVSISPLSPLIDLSSDQIYNREALFPRPFSSNPLHAVMWTREQNQKYPWTTEQNAANAVLHVFGTALAEASRHPDKDLTSSPVVARGVQIVDGKLDLVYLQLNTTDLSESNKVKNIVWVEKALPLYKTKPFYEQLESIDEVNVEAVAKLSALLLS